MRKRLMVAPLLAAILLVVTSFGIFKEMAKLGDFDPFDTDD
jgi:hypothetical protein